MATNQYFTSNHASVADQRLIQDLVVEAIKIYGRDMYYIPRESVAFDKLYGEDKLSAFNRAYLLEFYIDSVQGFGGERDIIAKFGLEIRDELILTVARSRFEVEVSGQDPTIIRPREGDLVYLALDRSLFEITFVEDEQIFHQLGKLYTYELSLKRFEKAAETFDTGISAIDRYEAEYGINTKLVLDTGTGDYTEGEAVYQGLSLVGATAQGIVISWEASTKSLVINKQQGEFAVGSNVVGETSGADYSYTSEAETDRQDETTNTDNRELDELAGDDVVITTETNPYTGN